MANTPRAATDRQTFTSADATGGGKYAVDTLTYPTDLYGSPEKYGNSWVMFNINILTTSFQSQALNEVVLTEFERKRFAETDARTQNGGLSDTAAAESLTLAGAAAGGISGVLAGGPGVVKKVLAGVKGAVAGGLTTGLALSPLLLGKARTTKRIKAAIQLPMPNELVTSYSMEWGAESTKIFDVAARLAQLASVDGIKNAMKSDITSLGSDFISSKGLDTGGVLGGSGGVSVASGLASNPKKEMIFNGVNFRNFTLNYTFYPKSEEEARNVDSIINTFKYHMHPEFRSEGRFTFVYPSEFDITFYTRGGVENLWVTRIATCVLRDMNINYAPAGLWAAHQSSGVEPGDLDGFPNMIQVSLTFQELSILSKEAIDKGF